MPLVIKELIIRAQVDTVPRKPPAHSAAAPGPIPTRAAQDAMVTECVEAVLDILRQKEER
jgi:hypothetical protein